jgi:hypothetical protein
VALLALVFFSRRIVSYGSYASCLNLHFLALKIMTEDRFRSDPDPNCPLVLAFASTFHPFDFPEIELLWARSIDLSPLHHPPILNPTVAGRLDVLRVVLEAKTYLQLPVQSYPQLPVQSYPQLPVQVYETTNFLRLLEDIGQALRPLLLPKGVIPTLSHSTIDVHS